MNSNLNIEVKIKKMSPQSKLPYYATPGSAGLDLSACIEHPIIIGAGSRVMIPTGIAVQMPSEYIVGLVFPRSGLASKYGITLTNCVGVIDSDYTGEIICSVHNHSDNSFKINPGDRIAQIVFMPVAIANLKVVEELEQTQRGNGGLGSTGIKIE